MRPGSNSRACRRDSSFTTNTRSNGRYSFENVTPGPGYQLTIRAIGFLPQVQQGLTLGLGTRLVRDVALKPSVVQLEEIEVAAQAGQPAARCESHRPDAGRR